MATGIAGPLGFPLLVFFFYDYTITEDWPDVAVFEAFVFEALEFLFGLLALLSLLL